MTPCRLKYVCHLPHWSTRKHRCNSSLPRTWSLQPKTYSSESRKWTLRNELRKMSFKKLLHYEKIESGEWVSEKWAPRSELRKAAVLREVGFRKVCYAPKSFYAPKSCGAPKICCATRGLGLKCSSPRSEHREVTASCVSSSPLSLEFVVSGTENFKRLT